MSARLQKIELWNFKSFRRATIPIARGFTAIAGPNGTGKSNILDALMFVLGMTSLKMLRANKLTDLVNNSASDSTARVDLHLKTVEKEYKVSRTIDRQGKSVYRLDDKRCSLNETASLLKELGMTAGGYNIVVQGDITRIIQMNPRERRQIIEEVSGIREFDDKKEEALKELGKVEVRVKEAKIVLNEREQFLKDLEAEREAAKKFESLTRELKESKATLIRLEIGALKRQNSSIEEKEKSSAERIAEKAEKRQEITEKITGFEQQIEDTNTALINANEEIFSEIGREAERKRAEKAIMEEKKSGLEREIAEIEERKKRFGEKKAGLEAEKKGFEERLAGLKGEAGELEKKSWEFEARGFTDMFFDAVKEQSAKQSELDGLLTAIKQLEKAGSNCPTCDSRITQAKRAEMLGGKKDQAEKCRQRLIELESTVQELERRRNEERVALDELREKRQEAFQAKTSLESAQKAIAETTEMTAEAEKREARAAEETKRLVKELEKAVVDMASLEAKQAKASEKNRGRMEQKETLKARLQELFQKKQALDGEIRKKEAELNELNIEKSKNSVRINDLQEEEREFEGMRTIEGAITGQLKERIPRIEREISSLGAINMKALESFGELEKEVRDLREKANKLEEERISVLNLIQSIEDRRMQVFFDCFNSVKENFSKIFYSFFEGEGTLGISDEENPLEAGLVIEAKHKGSTMKTIDLMSGGEKTLTALAFLFAIQFYEPSPFYVFDEADAALDKENSAKVARMAKDVSKKSQFIAITHNDMMVKQSDQVIGVALNKNNSSAIGLRLREKRQEKEEAGEAE